MQKALRSHCTRRSGEAVCLIYFFFYYYSVVTLKLIPFEKVPLKTTVMETGLIPIGHTQGQSITHSFGSGIRRRVPPRSLHIHVD